MNRKMNEAIAYVIKNHDAHTETTVGTYELSDYINDAANCFADSFDEYMGLYEVLTGLFTMKK